MTTTKEPTTCPCCNIYPATHIRQERAFSAVDPRGELVSSTRICKRCISLAEAMERHATARGER